MSSSFTMKMTLTQIEKVQQAQAQANQNFFLHLRLLQHSLMKTEDEAVFFIKQSKHLFWVCSWFCQDGRGRRKFEERASEMVCLFPVFYAGSVFNRHKELVLVSAFAYHPRPHRSFMATTDFFGVNFSGFCSWYWYFSQRSR